MSNGSFHRRSYAAGLIGAGIGASLSPALHEREAQECEEDRTEDRNRQQSPYRVAPTSRYGFAHGCLLCE